MSIHRWINTLRPFLFNCSIRGQKPMQYRNRCRPVLEKLEDRVTPSAGLTGGNQQLLSAYGQLPLSFEANQGQTAAQVQFTTHGSGGTVFLTSTGAVLSLTGNSPSSVARGPLQNPTNATDYGPRTTDQVALALNLVAANPNAAVVGLDQLPGISNYFIGNDPSQWHTNIPNYAKVEYQNVYPGINLVYYGNQQQLEYDYQLAPGADPSSIRFAVQGADSLSLDAKGNLILHTAIGDVLEHAPVIYQQLAGTQQPVSGQFVLLGNNEVGFQVGAYDASRPLVIDPVLSYSTYLGGDSNDIASGITVDGSGNAYATGYTQSFFPTTSGAYQTGNSGGYDAFVTKLNAAGSALVYSTYIGGSGYDFGSGIAVDGSGNAYVTGWTYSTDFPTTSGAYQTSNGGGTYGTYHAFVTRLNAAGTALIYSTYLAGNNQDEASAIAVDSSGSAYVTGQTASTNFPTTSGAYQTSNGSGFVTKLNSAGTALIYSTYLGNNGTGIAVDGSGNAYVTSGQGAFVTKLNAAGSALVYSTYLGGSGGADAMAIAVDGSGNAYVTGYTDSASFPTTSGAFQTSFGGNNDAFVLKLNAAGTALVYSTYLGGNNDDEASGIAVDGSGNAYVAGYTYSTNFPTTTGAYQISNGGGIDAFVTKLNAAGSALIYSTYLGGSSSDRATGVAVDGSGNAYVTGWTVSANFPTTSGAYQTYSGGNANAFVAKFALATPTTTTLTSSLNPSFAGQNVTFTATISGNGGNSTGTVTFNDGSTTLGVGNLSTPQPTGWVTEANLPTARSILAATTGNDGRIYAVGGLVSGAGADGSGRTNALEAYDPTTNSWATLANMPTPRNHLAAATSLDGRIFAFGGVSDSGYSVVEAYDPSTNTWATVASMPTARWGLAAVTGPDGRIYAIGGTTFISGTGVQTNTVEAYDPATNTWTTVASMPTARTYLAAAVGSDGRIYAIGGWSETGDFNTVEAYNVYTNTWSTVANMPTARHVLAAARGPDGRIYAMGGDSSSGSGVVEAYDTTTNSWSTVASLPTPRAGLAAATGPDGRIYAVGGGDGTGNLNTLEALSFTSPTATFSTSSLSVGSHSITAVYSGDVNFAGSTSSVVNQVVNYITTTTTLTDNGPNPSTAGQAVSFTATVSGGSAISGETVYIEDASNANAVVASPTLSGGTVTFTISNLTVGTHNLFAVYNGDDNNAGSNNSTTPVTQVVNPAGPAPTVSSVVVNGGAPAYTDSLGNSFSLAGQNSVVEQILVTFNEAVTLAAGAFSVTNNAAGVTVVSGSAPNTQAVNAVWGAPVAGSGNTQWIVTFSGPGTRPLPYGGVGNVIKDGLYILNINAADVTAISGGSPMAADNHTGFWALYGSESSADNVVAANIGDGNSEVVVDLNDFTLFKNTYNSESDIPAGPPPYDVAMDLDLAGFVDLACFTAFKHNYNADWAF